MTNNDIIKEIVEVHNNIAAISVHGDDAILMAQAILKARSLIQQLQQEPTERENKEE